MDFAKYIVSCIHHYNIYRIVSLCSTYSLSFFFFRFRSVQSLSCVQLFETLWTAACQASLSITNSQSSLKLMSIVGEAIQPSHPLSPSPPAFNLSQKQGNESNESVLHTRWPKYWSFSFSIDPSNEIRTDFL